MAAATRITGASSAVALHGVAALLIAVHEMDAVVDADADEGDHREDREEVELDAGERQQAGGPDQSDRGRQQREQRQPPVAERQPPTSATTMSVPIASPLMNCGRKRRASSRLTSVRPVRVCVGSTLVDNRAARARPVPASVGNT